MAARSSSIVPVLWVALALRLALPLAAFLATGDATVFHAPDSAGYLKLASEWLASGRFALDGQPEIFRTPGYPLFLAPGLLLGSVDLWALLAQAAVSCATVYLVFHVARLLFERPDRALLAAWLYACEPLSVLYSCRLLTETLFTGLLIAFLYFLLRYLQEETWWALVWPALFLAAAACTRPIAYFLPAVVAVALACRAAFGERKVLGLLHAAAFLLLAMVPLGLWQWRNAREAGYAGFAAITEHNLYFAHAGAVLAAQQGRPSYEVRRELGESDETSYLRAHPEQRAWTLAQRYAYMRAESRRILLAAPLCWAMICARGELGIFLDPGAQEYLKLFQLYQEGGGLVGKAVDQGPLNLAATLLRERPLLFWSNLLLATGLLFHLVCAGLALCSKGWKARKSAATCAVLGVGLFLLLCSAGPYGYHRFRHPLMPLVCILGGWGLGVVVERWKASSTVTVSE